jgi:hypothetical protein
MGSSYHQKRGYTQAMTVLSTTAAHFYAGWHADFYAFGIEETRLLAYTSCFACMPKVFYFYL